MNTDLPHLRQAISKLPILPTMNHVMPKGITRAMRFWLCSP